MVRLKENRSVLFRGEEHPLPLVAETLLSEPRTRKEGDCTYAKCDIGVTLTHDAEGKKLAPETRMYALVAVKREMYAKPLLLLLNGKVKCPGEAASLYADYLDRFGVEHGIRLWKHALDPAVVQLMTCGRIQGLLHLQTILLDFLLRETEDGRDLFGHGLEILERDYLYAGETLTYSLYVVVRVLRDLLRTETRHALHQPWRLHPFTASQLPLLTHEMLDAA